MKFWTSGFRFVDTWKELQSSVPLCDFCKLRWDASKHLDRTVYKSVSYERVDSTLRMNENHLPVFSIVRSLGKLQRTHNQQDLLITLHLPDSQTTPPFQIGLPQLPGPRSKSHFQTLCKWLKECDNKHQKCRRLPSQTTFLPTRLIKVGSKGSDTVQLYETQPTDSLNYVALSHPWGNKPPYFCTFRRTVEEYKKGIKVNALTQTFKDAIETTRELNLQYLWIDSICIIQRDETDEGDFEQEANHMENVFSSAYCVLAASSAHGQSDGFLNERKGSNRDFVTLKGQDQAPFWVCRFIDDFNQHVLEGPLNKRGWVLQERVLAHRTIYLTNYQTYWECGEGVRCETFTKMEK
jgi:hypothetical protein